MQKDRGIFISVEGGEGVGKSVFLNRLEKIFSERGISFIKTREPGGSPVAEKLRQIFNKSANKEKLTIEAELFLVSAARSQHVAQTIRPALERGDWVLCDRFVDSTRVYQGAMGGIPEVLLEMIINMSTQGLETDVTFLLDCDVATSLSRVRLRQESSSVEGAGRYDAQAEKFHEKLREAFLELSRKYPKRFIILDAQQETAHLAGEAAKIIQERWSGGKKN